MSSSAITGGIYPFKSAAGGFIAGENFVYDTDSLYQGTAYRSTASADNTAGATTAEQVLMDAYTGSKMTYPSPLLSSSHAAEATKGTLFLPRKESSMCLVRWSLLYAVATGATAITIELVFSTSGTRIVYENSVEPVGTHLRSGVLPIQLAPGETVKMYTIVGTAANYSFKKSTAGGYETSISISEIGPGIPASGLITVL